jgi:hypothetical protein
MKNSVPTGIIAITIIVCLALLCSTIQTFDSGNLSIVIEGLGVKFNAVVQSNLPGSSNLPALQQIKKLNLAEPNLES